MKTATGFFFFLTALSLISIVLAYSGIEKRRQKNSEPFASQDETYGHPNHHSLGNRLALFADTSGGCVLLWLTAAAVPIISGVLCFKNERMATGLLLLMAWTVLVALWGIPFWISSLLFAW